MSSITSVLGKRERPPFSKHYYPTGPGVMPSVSNRASGPSAPPPRALGPPQLGINIPVQSQSTTKYLDVNPTGSIPLMVRPWKELYEKDYAPGCLIFCKQNKTGRSPLITCADLPTMNFLLTEQGADLLKCTDYEFLGIFRNDAGKQVDHMGFPMYTNIKQRLIQCDVYGRAKVANMWTGKLRTGDSLEICLVIKNITLVKKPNRSGRQMPERPCFQLVPTVNGCIPDTNTKLEAADWGGAMGNAAAAALAAAAAAAPPAGAAPAVVAAANAAVAALNAVAAAFAAAAINPSKQKSMALGHLVQLLQDYPTTTPNLMTNRYIRKWRIGIVSQAAHEPPTKANIKLAMHDSQQRTHLPQLEVLMI